MPGAVTMKSGITSAPVTCRKPADWRSGGYSFFTGILLFLADSRGSK